MYLGNFIEKLEKKHSRLFFSGFAFNSREVKKNYIFFAIKGNKFDGNNFINDAINRGARIIISEKKLKINKKGIKFITNKNPRKYPPIMTPVIRLLFPAVEARTPRRTSWIPFPTMINARPKKRGHVDKRDRNI